MAGFRHKWATCSPFSGPWERTQRRMPRGYRLQSGAERRFGRLARTSYHWLRNPPMRYSAELEVLHKRESTQFPLQASSQTRQCRNLPWYFHLPGSARPMLYVAPATYSLSYRIYIQHWK